MGNVSKRKINSKIVKIKAPILLVQQGDGNKEPVWMERNFFPNLLDLIKEYKNVKLIFTGGSGFLIQNESQNENVSFKNLIKNLLEENER